MIMLIQTELRAIWRPPFVICLDESDTAALKILFMGLNFEIRATFLDYDDNMGACVIGRRQ